VGNGWATRAEFWTLPPGEVWWLIDAHLPPEIKDRDEKFSTLQDMLKKAKAAHKNE
jgi:hypothetical protein